METSIYRNDRGIGLSSCWVFKSVGKTMQNGCYWHREWVAGREIIFGVFVLCWKYLRK